MSHRKSFLSALLICSAALFGTGFRAPYFDPLSVKDGLSQNTVFSICQDSLGRMWLGTMDGLSRYDGYDFSVWRNSASDSASISSNIIRHLFTDSAGRVWAGTGKGLSLYNPSQENFRNWNDGEVEGIAQGDDGNLFVSIGGRLKIYSPGEDLWKETALNPSVHSGALCREGKRLWIAGGGGEIFAMDTGTGAVDKITRLPLNCPITAILADSGSLWIASDGNGLWKISADGKTCTGTSCYRQSDGLASDYVRSLAMGDSGQLWVGTYGGLCIFDGNGFHTVKDEGDGEGTLSQNSIRSICRDSQGGMWLGTYYKGVNYYNPLKNHFKSLHRQPHTNSLNDNVVNCFAEDSRGNVWIGTNTGGVNRWNPSSGAFRYWSIAAGGGSAPKSNDVKALWIDEQRNAVYVGAHAGGLSKINLTTGAVSRIKIDGEGESTDVYSIIPSSGGKSLWIGTMEGLLILSRESGKIISPVFPEEKEKFEGKSAKALLLDSGDRLWVGSESGLFVFNVSGDALYRCTDIPGQNDVFVQSLFEIPGKSVWAGTREGLWRYEFASGEWTRFTTSDGLPSNIVDGIVSDSYGMIWVSTDKGLCRFNPFSVSMRRYSTEDGLPFNLFNPSAAFRRANGDILFGGIEGVTYFSPQRLSDNPYSPSPVITGFALSGKYASEKVPLAPDGVRLGYDQNSFSVSFAVPNYIAGKHNTFSYILEGYDEQWTTDRGERTARWSNLPHGKYVFRLKSANNDGVWCRKPISLRITIAPAWWQSVPAIIGFVLLGVLLLSGAVLFFLRRKERQRKEALEIQNKAHQDEMQQMKTRFFINISHEMRSPLMLIINPLSEMIARCNDLWMRRQLSFLDRNARRLLHLVNQLIDYRRAELGVFRLSVREEKLLKLIKENWSYYESMARKKGLKYKMESDLGETAGYVDAQYIELILSNLLSNAFKYTESGSICLYASVESGSLVLRVSDTGVGISKENQSRIFERFFQVERDYVGSGIGLSLVSSLVELHHGTIELESEPGKGSTFTVRLPVGKESYSEEEIGEGAAEGANSPLKDAAYLLEDETEEGRESAAQPSEPSGGVILIAEDNAEMASYLKDALSGKFEIILSGNGEEALEALKESRPDLVITDMNMPVLDGVKLCTELKHDVSTSLIPVIVISSSTDEKDELAALRAGADDFISKPFPVNLLLIKIKNMLRMRERLSGNAGGDAQASDGQWVALSAHDEQLLSKATEIVTRNMDNADFSTADFASEMGMSRSSLHLKLKSLTGESALDFIRRIRFKEACRLLKDGRYSIAVISDMVGFNSPSYFATCFRRYMGCLPTEWVKRG